MSTSAKRMKRSVLFTTGIRSEYDILYSVMSAVDRHPATKARVVVTGAHLAQLYGRTEDLVHLDGFDVVARIDSLLCSDTAAARVKSAAIQMASLVDVVASIRPSMLVAMGDREEALTVASVGAYMGIPVAHIGGGDIAEDGNVDNAVRHAVTKLAHLHLVTTPRSAERVLRMGEEPWRIHVVGAPGLDRLLTTEIMSRSELSRHLDFDVSTGPIAVVIQHSISTQIESASDQMRTTLDAVAKVGLRTLVSYPNSDAGSQQIIAVINHFADRYPFIRAYRNLARDVFVNLLRNASVLIGNSSCGILEAPSLKLPVVNVGDRQVGREHAENVIFVEHDEQAVQAAIRRAVFDDGFRQQVRACDNPYGDGRAGERIACILAEITIDHRLISKRNTF